ncbi:MAG: hypothetical protein M0042_06815 [Nitrospiraceae bacterium]|nr:hypothetical protein [Nitrospiraceae bacterium]
MKRMIVILLLASAVMGMVPSTASARWDISIFVPLPGFRYEYIAPPPAPYGYVAPIAGPVFYGGYWYRSGRSGWSIAVQAGGPWYPVAVEYVPVQVIQAPAYQAPAYQAPTYQAPQYNAPSTQAPAYSGPGQDADGRYIPPRLYDGPRELDPDR